jgi:hypothetical protein
VNLPLNFRACSYNNIDAKRCSPLIEGVWAGRLVHLSGFDAVGATAGSLSRLFQDREIELWEAKRVVSGIEPEEVRWSV